MLLFGKYMMLWFCVSVCVIFLFVLIWCSLMSVGLVVLVVCEIKRADSDLFSARIIVVFCFCLDCFMM